MRLFIAAELPSELTDALVETQAALRDAVHGRYVAPDSLHVTLAFLGELPSGRLEEAAAALAQSCQGHGPLEATVGELGSFGRRRSATLWQAVHSKGRLASLAASLRKELAASSLPFDEKPFRAHVTLMRSADLSSGQLPMPTMGCGLIQTVTLFRSDLSGTRPRYEPLERLELGASDAGQKHNLYTL